MDNTYETGTRLWSEWMEMWNGNPELALRLVAPGFRLHLPTPNDQDQRAVDGPEAAHGWVTRHLAKFERLRFSFAVGPFVDERAGVVFGPWHAEVRVNGKWSLVCGMDTVVFRDGKITEYWTVGKEADEVGRWSTR